jgi:hypothetical protein
VPPVVRALLTAGGPPAAATRALRAGEPGFDDARRALHALLHDADDRVLGGAERVVEHLRATTTIAEVPAGHPVIAELEDVLFHVEGEGFFEGETLLVLTPTASS